MNFRYAVEAWSVGLVGWFTWVAVYSFVVRVTVASVFVQ